MLHQLSISAALRRLQSGEICAEDLTIACLDRIEKSNKLLNAFLNVDAEKALSEARRADAIRKVAKSEKSLLGVPIALKDNLALKDAPLSCASKILSNFTSPYDSGVAENLKKAGAILMGRLNLDEFAMGSSTENSAFGCTRNPWDLSRIPGGSSGGSAAAVAADLCIGALGSDTGGSIRQPAAFCGCVGLKPSYGRVSRYGLVAFASSLDQIGTMTKTVEDAALLLKIISGHDSRDSTSVPDAVPDFISNLDRNIKGLRIGLPKEYFIKGLDPEVRGSIEEAIETFQSLGAEMVEVSLPHSEYAIATYYLIATAEASANLARFEGIRYGLRIYGKDAFTLNARTRGRGFGAEVKRRILLGTYALSSGYYEDYYLRAQKVRTLICQDFEKAFEKADILLSPTTPVPAFSIGEKSDPLQMYLLDIFTIPANLTGTCAISLPCGFSDSPKLPIGLQLIGKPFGEMRLLQVAQAFEKASTWHLEKPPL